MLTKVKKGTKPDASSPQKKTAKAEARMPVKKAFSGPKPPEKNLDTKPVPPNRQQVVAAKSPAPKRDGAKAPGESVFPADFFSVMDEMEADAKKRRAVALKVMKKAVS